MKVINKYKASIPKGSVYIGRPSKYGNPFSLGKDGTREDIVKAYEEWINKQQELIDAAKKELKGKDLFCFCGSKPCHGDVLIKIENS